MECPHCRSSATTERPECTKLGYQRFRCRTCESGFNERTGTMFNRRTNRYLNHLEQDHRGIKQRTHSMCGFKSFMSAERFCRVYDEVRDFFRARSRRNERLWGCNESFLL